MGWRRDPPQCPFALLSNPPCVRATAQNELDRGPAPGRCSASAPHGEHQGALSTTGDAGRPWDTPVPMRPISGGNLQLARSRSWGPAHAPGDQPTRGASPRRERRSAPREPWAFYANVTLRHAAQPASSSEPPAQQSGRCHFFSRVCPLCRGPTWGDGTSLRPSARRTPPRSPHSRRKRAWRSGEVPLPAPLVHFPRGHPAPHLHFVVCGLQLQISAGVGHTLPGHTNPGSSFRSSG